MVAEQGSLGHARGSSADRKKVRTWASAAAARVLSLVQSQRAREPRRSWTTALAPKEWSAMGASSLLTSLPVFAACILAGCGGVIQPGLANAPSLNGTPETRVHDAIANGHDSCERSMFPQGEVLRGHIPSCAGPERRSRPDGFVLRSAAAEPSAPRLYWFGACPAGLKPGTLGTEKGMTAFPVSTPPPWVAC